MTLQSLPELLRIASEAEDPHFPNRQGVKFGGIDPLGMRQINFDLMDLVFPGVNNVARHIRPFTVATWAWRRAGAIATARGMKDIAPHLLEDFAARIEVIYVWSQFAREREADLPGRDVFTHLLQSDRYTFDGAEWAQRRKIRRMSTAISSPINYGPALKTLGWVVPHDTFPGIMRASLEAAPALDAFEALLRDRLKHPAFSEFGSVTVTSEEAAGWADAWRLDDTTPAEKEFMRISLSGHRAPKARRAGVTLMMTVKDKLANDELNDVRKAMYDPPSNVRLSEADQTTARVWKQIQVRQLFRLVLEALFHWIQKVLADGALPTKELVERFWASAAFKKGYDDTASWLTSALELEDPVKLQDHLKDCLDGRAPGLERTIVNAIALALRDSVSGVSVSERDDRLPLDRAQREAKAWAAHPPREFIRHILESWVLAQHVYWSVGRGLADARSRGKTILRLKVILEESGWTMTPGATVGAPPARAGDRLRTILSLANEAQLSLHDQSMQMKFAL